MLHDIGREEQYSDPTVDHAIHAAINDQKKISYEYFDYNAKKQKVNWRSGALYIQTPINTEEQYKAANANVLKRDHTTHRNARSSLMFARKLKCGHCNIGLNAVHRKNDVKYHCNTAKLTDKFGCTIDDWIFEQDIADAVLV